MRWLVATSLVLLATATTSRAGHAQAAGTGDSGLTGSREIGIFGSARVLSTEYSSEDGRIAFGGTAIFATHLRNILAVQGGLGFNYSRQEYSYYKPPLFTITPTISLIVQKPMGGSIQPYGIAGAGYEFVRYTHPRCDCEQSRSLGIGQLGVGVRRMVGPSRAVRAELSSQIGKGGPAITMMAGMSVFTGSPRSAIQPPARVRPEPSLITPPRQTGPAAAPATAPAAPPPPPPRPVPSNDVVRPAPVSPLPSGAGAVLLTFDGTQVDFTRPNWREEAETLLDGLVVDLTSDAGLGIRVSIEAHTDNVGSDAANMVIGLDRARAVAEYLVSQGVASDRIRVSSEGEENPIAPNTTAIGRQQNRRIVIKREN